MSLPVHEFVALKVLYFELSNFPGVFLTSELILELFHLFTVNKEALKKQAESKNNCHDLDDKPRGELVTET